MAATEDTAVTLRVPVIDLGAAADASVLASVRSATEATGVVAVVNHGVPLDLLDYLGQHPDASPADDPELRDLTFRYTAAGQALAERVLGLYARAQGLADGVFPVDPLPHLSLHSAARGDEADSVLTVLAQAGGRTAPQVRSPGGGWLPVPERPGALLVFSGRLLARWTNGRLPQARYRMAPDGPASGGPAVSLDYPAFGRVPGPLGPFAGPAARWDLIAEHLGVFCCPARAAA